MRKKRIGIQKEITARRAGLDVAKTINELGYRSSIERECEEVLETEIRGWKKLSESEKLELIGLCVDVAQRKLKLREYV
jgi:hypothetical protein